MSSNPYFIETYRIDLNWQTYTNFINHLRERMADQSAPHIQNRRQLPLEQSDQQQSRQRWVQVVLINNNEDGSQITLRIRHENVYLDAYQIEVQNRRWAEYSSPHSRLIPDSILIPSDGSYRSLEYGTTGRANIPLNLLELQSAVTTLAHLRDHGNSQARHYQMVVIQMICEAVRFECIRQHLVVNNGIPGAPPWMLQRENTWGSLSRTICNIYADRRHALDESKEFQNYIDIDNLEDACRAIGIIKPDVKRHQSRGLKAVADDYNLVGGPKLEVYEVRINKTLDYTGSPAQVRGSITVNSAFTYYLYNRDKDHPEIVKVGNSALLTGPLPKDGAISACDPFAIDVDLWDYMINGPNYQISKGSIFWNVYNLDSRKKYDKLYEEKIQGIYDCSATIKYAVFSDAVTAKIEVTFVGYIYDNSRPANLYGRIVAQNEKFDGSESVLFDKGVEDRINISLGEKIPLSRSIVAAPVNCNFYFTAILWDYGDYEIAYYTTRLWPKSYGDYSFPIEGQYGKIQVKVTWHI